MSQITFPKKVIYKHLSEMSNVQAIAETIANIVEGNKYVYLIEANRWQLGNGNNFWLSSEGDNYKLIARYWSDEQLNAVKAILMSRSLC